MHEGRNYVPQIKDNRLERIMAHCAKQFAKQIIRRNVTVPTAVSMILDNEDNFRRRQKNLCSHTNHSDHEILDNIAKNITEINKNMNALVPSLMGFESFVYFMLTLGLLFILITVLGYIFLIRKRALSNRLASADDHSVILYNRNAEEPPRSGTVRTPSISQLDEPDSNNGVPTSTTTVTVIQSENSNISRITLSDNETSMTKKLMLEMVAAIGHELYKISQDK